VTCPAQAVSAAAADKVSWLLEDASRPPAQLELIPPADERPSPILGCSDGNYQDPSYEVLVRLLGEISVVGGTRTLKPKQTAVLAYIALYGPASSEAVEDAVWVAPTSSRRKRLANTVSECRTALGAVHLPINTDGRYRVGPGVVTDLDLFERRVAYAATQDDGSAIGTLRGALELVEGPVFTYRSAERASYVWVDVGNWHSTWELKVTDAAEDLAQRCLDRGDLDGAVWATQRGLHAAKTHPRLTKLLIQAYVAKGDANAAAQVFEAHQAALHELDLDEVDPELVEYYQSARAARGAAAG
jgi:DNA-binding SARP family transcriptional activator